MKKNGEKMKNIKSLGLNLGMIVVVGLGLSGCGAVPFPGNTISDASIYHDKNKTTGIKTIRTPELNIMKTMEVGESLYEKTQRIDFDTYEVSLLSDTQAELFNGGFIKTDRSGKADKILSPLYAWSEKSLKAMCLDAGMDYNLNRPIKICLIDTENKGFFTQAAYSYKDQMYSLTNNAQYELSPTPPKYDKNYFRYIALYQGKIDNKIKVSFREFLDNTSRPAFTQDIEYELNKNGETIIGFKGLRIKVIKATNTDITYSVIQDYN